MLRGTPAEVENEIFKQLGLETRVELYKGSPNDFNASKLDKTDGVAVMGFKSAVSEFTKEKLTAITSESYRQELDSDGFQKNDNLPEKSQNPGSVIALDAGKAASTWALNTRSNRGLAMGFALAHGAGHNAGTNHTADGIMTEGLPLVTKIIINTTPYEDLIKFYSKERIENIRKYQPEYKSLMNFVCPRDDGANELYINNMVRKFGTNEATSNYKN